MRLRGNIAVFGAPTLVGLWTVYGFAWLYLTGQPRQFGIYAPRHEWLYAHILAGALALLSCPFQLWVGLNRRNIYVHVGAGSAYVLGVVVSSVGAFYLAAHTDFGWVFGLGFASMAGAWLITTGMALFAIL